MKLGTMKELVVEWIDYYGQDIADTQKIADAKTIEELIEVINDHIRFLRLQNIDAITHAENFKKIFQSAIK